MYDQVNKILKEKVSPILKAHYGDIELKEVVDGIAKVRMTGACGTCPSAQSTVENIVETILRENIPELEGVEMVNEVSDDLIEMAKKILNKDKK